MELPFFIGLGSFVAHEWEEYSSYFGEGIGVSRSWATVHFLAFMATAPGICYNELSVTC